MKKRNLSLMLCAGLGALALSSYEASPATKSAAGNRTGAAGSPASCSGGGCHAASSSATTAAFVVADPAAPTTPVSQYVPGKTYTVTIGGTNTSAKPKFGFQAAVTNASNASTGTLTATASSTAVHTASSIKIVEHTTPLSGSSGVYTVSFSWVAPAAGTGTVTFYGMLNAVDGTGTTSNDQPSNGFTLSLTEKPASSITENSISNKLLIVPNPAQDFISVKGLSTNTASVAIFSVSGAQVISTANTANINIASLAKGTYVLSVLENGQRSSAVFVKE
ncbi:choice-of-anchor V domain-containing protein [Rurimicrobium arvi]